MERNPTTASRSRQHQTVLPMERSSQRTSQRIYIGACSPPGPIGNSKPSPPSTNSQLSSPSHLSTISINGGQTNTFSSHRSTATDSSGFSSGASTTTNRRDKSRTSPNNANLNNYNHLSLQRDSHLTSEQHETRINQIRNKLIEDLRGLEQLAAAAAEARQRDQQLANGCQSISYQADKSHHHQLGSDRFTARHRNGLGSQQTTPASTLSRCSTAMASSCADMDCTTLCRDEFSSFIDYNKPAENLHNLMLPANGPNPNNMSYDKKDSDRAGSKAASSLHSIASKQRASGSSSRRRRSGATSSKSRHKSVGPMLVGVHEYEAPRQANYLPSSSAFNSSNSSPSCSEQNLAFVSSSSEQNSSSFRGAGDSFDDCFDDENNLDRDQPTGRQSRFNGIPIKQIVTPTEMVHCEAHVEENFSDDSCCEPFDDRRQLNQLPSDQTPSPCVELNLLSKGGDDDKLSEALDVYLRRVEALLKLANNDKSISLNQLLDERSSCDGDQSNQLEVRDEFKTTFTYVPHACDGVQSKPRVIQELEMENINTDQTDPNDCDSELRETQIVRTNLGSNFADLFASPQTSAILNWNSSSEYQLDDNNNRQRQHKPIDEQQCRLLERSLLSRWLELGSEEGELESGHYENLVKTIRRHMGEFVADYNAYKETMCHETSFARDWHENWLFATSTRKCMPLKRAHQLSDLSSGLMGHETVGSCSSDEHFLSDPNGPELSPKRAKMMRSSGSFELNELLNYSTLLINKYKPVKVTFVDLQDNNTERENQLERTRISQDEQQVTSSSNKWWHRIESWYEQQPEYLMELKQSFSQLSGQVNVCNLLLHDLFADDQELSQPEVLEPDGVKRARRPIEIKFATSFNSGRSQIEGQFLEFVAYGYVFELNRLRHYNCLNELASYRLKLDACKKLILARIRSLCHKRSSGLDDDVDLVRLDRVLTAALDQRDRAQFLVKVSNFQATFAWPVVQFCAHVSGALPLRVTWFKVLDDGSELELLPQSHEIEQKSANSSRQANKTKFSLKQSTTIKPHEWPLSMWTKYEFEYQTDWLSWYKFKRDMKQVVFEIRQPHPEHDMSHRFRCELENFYNIKTCEFRWDLASEKMLVAVESVQDTSRARRQILSAPDQAIGRTRAGGRTNRSSASRAAGDDDDQQQFGRVKLNKVELSNENQEAGQAILRTWSQRTLNKRAPLVDDERQIVDGANCSNSPMALHDGGQMQAAGQQQLRTVGRLSAQAMNDCQFGTDYPYHPKSLMERLERNKVSPLLNSRRAGSKGRTLRITNVDGHDNDDDHRKRQIHDQTDERFGPTNWADDNEERNATAGFVALELVSEQARKGSEPTANRLSSSPLGFSSIPELNRPEDMNCGAMAGGQRPIGATLVRSSNWRPDDSPSSSRRRVELLASGQSNQDNNNNNNEQAPQQKANEEGSNQTKLQQADRTGHEPTPMPRQKPRGHIGATDRTSAPRRQPLVELKRNSQQDDHHQQYHYAQIRFSDSLEKSINSSTHPPPDVVNVNANYSSGRHDVQWENSQPVSTWTRPDLTANCVNSAQVARLSPDSESRTSCNQTKLEQSSLNLAEPKPAYSSREADGSSVKSLISRFNMI